MEQSKKIDLNQWNRADAYHWFGAYEDPFFNFTIELDVTPLWECCHVEHKSVHHALLYAAIHVANQYEPMRLRRRDDGVILYDTIHIGCTVMQKGSDAFTFAYYPYNPEQSFEEFYACAVSATEQAAAGTPLDPKHEMDDLIYATTAPWLHFTSFKHARKQGQHSIPKMVFGKIIERNGRYTMPFNLEADHALMDGLHAAQYIDQLQDFISEFYTKR